MHRKTKLYTKVTSTLSMYSNGVVRNRRDKSNIFINYYCFFQFVSAPVAFALYSVIYRRAMDYQPDYPHHEKHNTYVHVYIYLA